MFPVRLETPDVSSKLRTFDFLEVQSILFLSIIRNMDRNFSNSYSSLVKQDSLLAFSSILDITRGEEYLKVCEPILPSGRNTPTSASGVNSDVG